MLIEQQIFAMIFQPLAPHTFSVSYLDFQILGDPLPATSIMYYQRVLMDSCISDCMLPPGHISVLVVVMASKCKTEQLCFIH